MQAKLRSFTNIKQNDITDYEKSHKNKISQHLQPHTQNINYSQTKFFVNCEQFLHNVKQDARQQQKLIEHKRKMKLMQQQEKKQKKETDKVDEMLLINVLMDYFRTNNMNYCYSMIMRQKNLISEDVVMKGQLAQVLGLKKLLQNDERLNVSVLELLFIKFNHLRQLLDQKQKLSNQVSIQCQLLLSNNQHNNMLLTQLKLQQIRKQTQLREKKHYESQIHLFKSQQLLKLKEDMNRLYEAKQAKLVQKYEEKLRDVARGKGDQEFDRSSKQVEEYLNEIQVLKRQLRSFKDQNNKLQKRSLEHDCLKHPNITNQLQLLNQQRKQLQLKKQQFQLALRNLTTNVQDLAQQKNRLLTDNRKETEEYLAKVKTHKENKDYMIEKVYGMLTGFEVRIDNLSKDNAKLYQENQGLRRQVDGFRKIVGYGGDVSDRDRSNRTNLDGTRNISDSTYSNQNQLTKKTLNLTDLKIPTKNVLIGITPEEILAETQPQMQQSKVSSQESVLTYTTEEYEQKMRQKSQQTEKINRLKMEMGLLKNKVKWMVMDFQN